MFSFFRQKSRYSQGITWYMLGQYCPLSLFNHTRTVLQQKKMCFKINTFSHRKILIETKPVNYTNIDIFYMKHILTIHDIYLNYIKYIYTHICIYTTYSLSKDPTFKACIHQELYMILELSPYMSIWAHVMVIMKIIIIFVAVLPLHVYDFSP